MSNIIGFLIAPAPLLMLALVFARPMPQPTVVRPELVGLLDCETHHSGGVPEGWNGVPPGTFAVDGQTVHSGRWALRIERQDTSPNAFTSGSKMSPLDFSGA